MLLHLLSSLPSYQVPNVIFFIIFSKDFFWFSLWWILSCMILFLHQLGNNTYGDLLLANPWKIVLKLTGGFRSRSPFPQEKGLIPRQPLIISLPADTLKVRLPENISF